MAFSRLHNNNSALRAETRSVCQADILPIFEPIFSRFSSVCLPDIGRYRPIFHSLTETIPKSPIFICRFFLDFSHSSWTSCRFFSLISKQKPWLIPVLYHGNQNKYLTLELSSFIFVQIMFIIAVVWSASLCSCVGLRSLAHFKYGVFFSSCCILREIWAS